MLYSLQTRVHVHCTKRHQLSCVELSLTFNFKLPKRRMWLCADCFEGITGEGKGGIRENERFSQQIVLGLMNWCRLLYFLTSWVAEAAGPMHGRVLQTLWPRGAQSHCFQEKYMAMKSLLPRLLAFSWPPTNPFPWLFYCIRQALNNFLFISSLKLWNVISGSAEHSQQQHITLGPLL